MDIKDEVVRLYVKKYVMPRALIFDKPGFVDFKISGKTNIFARQILMPESLFVTFEKNLIEKTGDKGAKKLYSVGKQFGWSFAQLGRFENIKDHPGEGVKDWVVIATKFIEGTYASNISQSIDVSQKSVDFSLTNFSVCEKLGYDYFLAVGGAAGVMAWIFQDPAIEGVLYESKTQGEDNISKVLCAPSALLSTKFDKEKVFTETNLSDFDPEPANYQSLNEEVDFGESKSFQSYLNSKIFDYSRGKITYNGERFFLMEATSLYILERALDKEDAQILADAAFSVGYNIFGDFGGKSLSAVSELLTALGWGKVSVLGSSKKPKVIIEHYPWTKFYNDIDYVIPRFLLSGILSKLRGEKIQLGSVVKDISKGYLNLMFE